MNLAETLNLLPETDGNVISVLSGGLDSTIMTYTLKEKYGHRVIAVSYDYNQKQKAELEKAAQTCAYLGIEHKILDLSILGNIAREVSANIGGSDVSMPTIREVLGDPQPKTYVPFRNMIINSITFSLAEAKKSNFVFTGLQIHDEYGYWDTTSKFVDSMNNVAAQNRTFKIKLIAPFSGLSKFQELEIAKEIGNIKYELTLTCYNPDDEGRSCGKCPSCSERIANFIKAGIKDPIPYQTEIPWNTLIK